MDTKEAKEKLTAGKDKVNEKIKSLALRGIVEKKIPAETRAKFPVLDKLIPLTNYIACGLVVVIVVVIIAIVAGVGSRTNYNLKLPIAYWTLAGLPPLTADRLFMENNLKNDGSTKTVLESTSVSDGTFTGNFLVSIEGIRAARVTISLKTDTSGDFIMVTGVALTDLISGQKQERKYDGTEDSAALVIGNLIGITELYYDTQKLYAQSVDNQSTSTAASSSRSSATPSTAKEEDFTVSLTRDGSGVVIAQYNGNLTALTIPSTIQGMPVKEIGEQAFVGKRMDYTRPLWNGAVDITSVVIPSGVTTIGNTAFGSQQRLTSITIPGTVTSIGGEAFKGCTALASITIPNSVTSIGNSIFEGCSSLASITIPDNVRSIGDRAFAMSGLRSITWPASVTTIQALDTYGQMGMFAGCKNLQTVIIQEGVTEIGDYAFRECTTLSSVTLPSTIKKIGTRAFLDCFALTTIVIPDTVVSITFNNSGSYSSFSGSPNLTLASQAAIKSRGYSGDF